MLQDLRFAIRSALRNPALTTVIVASLALGIGANTTIFTLINAVFLRPLPVPDPERLAQLIRQLDATMPMPTAFTMLEVLRRNMWSARLGAMLLAVFGLLAVTLTTVGIYGVMAYSVTQRTREIGIRMALGAAHAAVMRMVLRRGLKLTCLGVAIGLAAAFAATRLIANLLFVSPTDSRTFVAISVLLSAVALAASFLPARRAARVDPLVALRLE
jgi:putative ABC transport system permease protein